MTVSAATLLLASLPASAAIVLTQGANYNLGGDSSWKGDKDLAGPGALVTDSGFAGAYNVRVGNTAAQAAVAPIVQAFCIDLFLGINATNGTYTQDLVSPNSNTLADMTRVSRAAWIFSDVFPRIAALAAANSTTAQTVAVALQFALWETMIDNPTVNLSAGYFQRNGGVVSNTVNYEKAITLATAFANGTNLLTAYSASVAANSIILVDAGFNRANPTLSTNTQRLIYYQPVPEPSTLALFGSALTALGLISRRRKG